MSIRVVLADDHVMVRQALKAFLERSGLLVVGEGADGQEAVRLARERRPDVAVLDLAMPLLNGVDAAREIRRDASAPRIILVTVHADDRYVLEALRAGVQGYILKTQPLEDLRRAIDTVMEGETYLSPAVSRAVVAAYLASERTPPRGLSRRERQVLQLVAEGKTTKEIAGLIGVSVKTADSHRMRLMRKLDVHTTAELVRYAIREGLITP